ncbi:imm11 family protein [Snodgrassella alvi]|uniref:imm11 family protein n=1 Tax=Snodgrassella alvi TaxID=1196083 RepID=UPI00351582DC
MIYELMIGNYPDSYWFQYISAAGEYYELLQCKKIQSNKPVIFKLEKKVSEKRLLSYDIYFSDGPVFISPRLANLLSNNQYFLHDVQLIEATIIVNGRSYSGYKVLNILRLISCIDMNKSEYVPLLESLPDGPKKFFEIVFKENINEQFCMARCEESEGIIVISESLRQFFIKNKVKGIDLYT